MGWLSDLFKNEQTSQLEGWQPAMGGLNAAMGLGEDALSNPWDVYGGQQVAGFNPLQNQALGAMGGYGAPDGMGGNIANQFQQGGSAAYGAGLGGYGATLGGLAGGAPQVGQLNQGYAQSIADNPYVDSQITAALRDPYRGLTEGTLPGLAGGAAGAGQFGGSELSQGSDIARRGYEDRAADVGAGFRGAAYGQGLGIANQQATMNPALQNQAYGLMNQASSGLAGMGQYGLNNAYGMGQNNIGMGLTAGNIQQGQEQTELDSLMNNFYLGQQLPMMQAQQGIGMFQPLAQNFGEQTQTNSVGLGNAAINIAGQVAGAYLTGGGSLLAGAAGGGGGGASPGWSDPWAGGYGAPAPAPQYGGSPYMPTAPQYFGNQYAGG